MNSLQWCEALSFISFLRLALRAKPQVSHYVCFSQNSLKSEITWNRSKKLCIVSQVIHIPSQSWNHSVQSYVLHLRKRFFCCSRSASAPVRWIAGISIFRLTVAKHSSPFFFIKAVRLPTQLHDICILRTLISSNSEMVESASHPTSCFV